MPMVSEGRFGCDLVLGANAVIRGNENRVRKSGRFWRSKSPPTSKAPQLRGLAVALATGLFLDKRSPA